MESATPARRGESQFHAAVQQEAAKFAEANSGTAAAAMEMDGPHREQLQEDVKKAEAAVASVEALD